MDGVVFGGTEHPELSLALVVNIYFVSSSENQVNKVPHSKP